MSSRPFLLIANDIPAGWQGSDGIVHNQFSDAKYTDLDPEPMYVPAYKVDPKVEIQLLLDRLAELTSQHTLIPIEHEPTC